MPTGAGSTLETALVRPAGLADRPRGSGPQGPAVLPPYRNGGHASPSALEFRVRYSRSGEQCSLPSPKREARMLARVSPVCRNLHPAGGVSHRAPRLPDACKRSRTLVSASPIPGEKRWVACSLRVSRLDEGVLTGRSRAARTTRANRNRTNKKAWGVPNRGRGREAKLGATTERFYSIRASLPEGVQIARRIRARQPNPPAPAA